MDMLKNPAIIGGILTFIGTISMAVGKPALAAVITDPATANAVTGLLTAVAAAVATFSHPPAKAS